MSGKKDTVGCCTVSVCRYNTGTDVSRVCRSFLKVDQGLVSCSGSGGYMVVVMVCGVVVGEEQM